MSDLLALTTSVRASLGAEVESILRSASVLQDFELEDDRKPAIFVPGAYTETKVMKEATMAFYDLRASDVASLSGLPNAQPAVKALRDNLMATMAAIAEGIDTSKTKAQLYYAEASRIQEAMKAGEDFESMIQPLIKKATETEEKCKDAVTGEVGIGKKMYESPPLYHINQNHNHRINLISPSSLFLFFCIFWGGTTLAMV